MVDIDAMLVGNGPSGSIAILPKHMEGITDETMNPAGDLGLALFPNAMNSAIVPQSSAASSSSSRAPPASAGGSQSGFIAQSTAFAASLELYAPPDESNGNANTGAVGVTAAVPKRGGRKRPVAEPVGGIAPANNPSSLPDGDAAAVAAPAPSAKKTRVVGKKGRAGVVDAFDVKNHDLSAINAADLFLTTSNPDDLLKLKPATVKTYITSLGKLRKQLEPHMEDIGLLSD